MLYLRRFWQSLLTTFLQLERVPRTVTGSERITRYLFSKTHVKRGQVSSTAFIPPKTKDLSVYRTSRCGEGKIWLLGELFVERQRKDRGRILARGDLPAAIIFEQGLKILPSVRPHPRHATVIDWPDDKPHQRMKAIVLALNSSLLWRPRHENP